MQTRIILNFFTLAVLLTVMTIPGYNSKADNSPQISEVTVSYEFGSQLQIDATFIGYDKPESIYITLQPDTQSPRKIELIIGEDNAIHLSSNLLTDPLKPFSRVYFWYQFQLPGAEIVTSPSYWFDYFDNRVEWNHINSKLFEIYWVNEDLAFGQAVMNIATQGLENVTKILPFSPQLPIKLYVYPDVDTLSSTLASFQQDWVAGRAYPNLGVILVSAGTSPSDLIDLERQIPHELMHILEYQVMGERYSDAPAWLLEGLATYAQTYPNPEDERNLENAILLGNLFHFDELCLSFPPEATSVNIAYAQSRSMVEYLENRFGSSVFVKVLEFSTDGLSCSESIKKATSFNLTRLEKDWRKTLTSGGRVYIIPPWVYILSAAILVVFFSITILIVRHRKKHDNSR